MKNELDQIDQQILRELAQDARLSYSEIGRRVNLSQPTVAERVRRMEQEGVIRGYHVDIDPEKVGLPITAFVRLKTSHPSSRQYKLEEKISAELDSVCECHRVTGNDCLLLKVYAASIVHLHELLGKLNQFGEPNTSIVLHTVIERSGIGGAI